MDYYCLVEGIFKLKLRRKEKEFESLLLNTFLKYLKTNKSYFEKDHIIFKGNLNFSS